jgi:hypothetical protein
MMPLGKIVPKRERLLSVPVKTLHRGQQLKRASALRTLENPSEKTKTQKSNGSSYL